MNEQIIAAGFGGQGVMSLGYILAAAGMRSGLHVSHYPSYGAEMRGGTANCAVVISDTEIASPLVPVPNVLFIMNDPSYMKFYSQAADNALVLLNDSLVTKNEAAGNKTIAKIKANDIAIDLGNPRIANMVMLGAYCAKRPDVISKDSLTWAIEKILGGKGKDLIKLNLTAVESGIKAAS